MTKPLTAPTLEQAFLRSICETPRDMAPRLIFADWLEDNGQPERAEFIRVSLAVVATGQVDCERKRPSGPGTGGRIRCGRCDFCRPMRRAEEIHSGHSASVIGPMPFSYAYTVNHWSLDEDPSENFATVYLWGGFVAAVCLPERIWLRHGRTLCLSSPIEHVVLPNKRPDDCCRWHCYAMSAAIHGSEIDSRIFGLLRGGFLAEDSTGQQMRIYNHANYALDDLSQACVAWGRQQAGLPPLPA